MQWRSSAWLCLAFALCSCSVAPTFALAFDSPSAVVIHLDDSQRLIVASLDGDEISLPKDRQGLVVWSEGGRERWQVFTGRWKKPQHASSDTLDYRLMSASRGGQHTPSSPQLAQATTLITQLRTPPLNRDAGSILTPYDGAVLLNPRVTFRRESSGADGKLPAVKAKVFRGDELLLNVPFEKNATTVRWEKSEVVAADLRAGLEPGSYRLEIESTTGLENIRFKVANKDRREAVERHSERLAALLDDESNPLVVQVAAEQMLLADPPHLADALDVLERIPPEKLTAHLAGLKEHVGKRLLDPAGFHEFRQASGDETGDELIDDIRSWIAASQWESALDELDALLDEADVAGRRRALAHLYRGVVLAESGPAREAEARREFQRSIAMLKSAGQKHDRYRAHNNYANFLLGRALDRLHNHAFQMAAGVRFPLLLALEDWMEAAAQYKAAMDFCDEPGQRTTIQINRARLYAALADVVHTIAPSDGGEPQFQAVTQAARATAERLSRQATATKGTQPLVRAIGHELLAHLSLRNGEIQQCEQNARLALNGYIKAGTLVGAESASRLLGLCLSKSRPDKPSDSLRHFVLSEHLSQLLRSRYPADTFGLARSGFLARRTDVNERLVGLLLAEGDAVAALEYAERVKARSLGDVLALHETSLPDQEVGSSVLASWPDDVVGIEYFLGWERSWVFVITRGEVKAYVVRDDRGSPIPTRELVSQIQDLIAGLDHLGPVEGRRLAYRAVAGSSVTFDRQWQDDLHRLYRLLLPSEAVPVVRSASTVLIVPHHILHYFPFAALVTELDSGEDHSKMPLPRFLIEEEFSLVYAPSLATWHSLRQRENRELTEVRALGIVDFDGRAQRLSGVKREIANLKGTFGGQLVDVLTDKAVTRANVLRLLREPGILSVATHGQKEPDKPLDSFLVCRDEKSSISRLTAADIYAAQVNSDLVLLNACYGGYGDRSPMAGDDLFGIQRALLHAGARTVVSGQWDIYDATAPDIMRDFYEGISKGCSAADALVLAQRKHLKKWRQSSKEALRFLTHPYYWAVFTVAGDDRTGNWKASEPDATTPKDPEDPVVATRVPDKAVAASRALPPLRRNELEGRSDVVAVVDVQSVECVFRSRSELPASRAWGIPLTGRSSETYSYEAQLKILACSKGGLRTNQRIRVQWTTKYGIIGASPPTYYPGERCRVFLKSSQAGHFYPAYRSSSAKHTLRPGKDVLPTRVGEVVRAEDDLHLIQGRSRAVVEEAGFQRFVDNDLVERGIREADAGLLADLSLLMGVAEQAVGRPHPVVPASLLLELALRASLIKGDQTTLQRLSRIAQARGDQALADRIAAITRLTQVARSDARVHGVSPKDVDPVTISQYRDLSHDIQTARLLGDSRELDSIVRELEKSHLSQPLLERLRGEIREARSAGQDASGNDVRILAADSRGLLDGITGCLPPYNRMNVDMDVLVDGKPLRRVSHNGRVYVPAPGHGVEYAIRVHNRGSKRIVAIVSVDGLSVMNGRPASSNGSGYIVRPRSSYTITGWRRGSQKVAAFSFQPRVESYAARTGQPSGIGQIRLIAIEELVPQPPRPPVNHYGFSPPTGGRGFGGMGSSIRAPSTRSARSAGTGTGYGRELDSRVTSVSFRRSNNRRTVTLFYDTWDALAGSSVSPDNFTPPPPPRTVGSNSGDVCRCACHANPGVRHIVACCSQCPHCSSRIVRHRFDDHKRRCSTGTTRLP